MPVKTSAVDSLRDVAPAEWDALVEESDPFCEYAFLWALEASGSVGAAAGWRPRFVLARQGERLVGAVPLYLKDNSHGEFIFDWGWAGGAHRAGLRYYPKLVAAVPFTPATGRRLLVHPTAPRPAVTSALLDGVRAVADAERASSVHVLFCTENETREFQAAGYKPRLSSQYHWTNREPPYRDFDDFLGAFRSRHRKQVRKERAVAQAHGLDLATLTGPELGDAEWTALEAFYRANADKHGGIAYLAPRFFHLARQTLAARVVATFAYRDRRPIAGALNFERGRHLYGRYWGALEERDMLHFELCYYRLIERAITRGHTRFEAGAQGSHKLSRGLAPAFTHSAHWIRHPGLRDAVERSIDAEAVMIRAEVAQDHHLSPYHRE